MEIISQFIFGATLGLSAGLIPGPFLSVVVSQTIKYGFSEGVKVAFSVLLTDGIFISLTLLTLSIIGNNNLFLGTLSIIGSVYLLKLAYDNFTTNLDEFIIKKNTKPRSLQKGILVLLLSPGSYIFWFTLAGPILAKTYEQSLILPVVFLLGIYLTFIGSNIIFALSIVKTKKFFQSQAHLYLLKIVAIFLAVFALVFFYNGLKMLELITIPKLP